MNWQHLLMSFLSSIIITRGVPVTTDTDWNEDALRTLRNALKQKQNWGVAKNVILFIGDGMGVSTVTTARIYDGQNKGNRGEDHVLSVGQFPVVALSKTYDATNQVPDSGATATALLCGAKATFGTVGVTQHATRFQCKPDPNSNKPQTQTSILQWSLEKDKAVGVITNTRITHATPAAAYAHSVDRDWESDADIPQEARNECDDLEDIASQLVTKNPNIKVLMGGGRTKFLNNTVPDVEYGQTQNGSRQDGRDLITEWLLEKSERGVHHAFVWNMTEFEKVDPDNTEYLLGLFEPSHMHYALDRAKDGAGEPSLTEMTEKAIEVLSKNDDDNGFFLLVEGGRIDHAHHETNAKRAMEETVEFMSAVQKAVDMTDDKDTLIVVTADHSHVYTMGGYSLRGNPILGTVDNASITIRPALDDATYLTLMYANGPGPTRRLNLTDIDTKADDFLQTVAVQMPSETHGGEDVAIYARGPMAHLFQGTHEQNYVAYVMAYASCVGAHQEHCDEDAKHEPCPANSVGLVYVQLESLLFLLAAWVTALHI